MSTEYPLPGPVPFDWREVRRLRHMKHAMKRHLMAERLGEIAEQSEDTGEDRGHRGGRRRGGRRGFGPDLGPGFGPGFGPFGREFGRGFGPHGHRGGRARRGDVRAAILALLAEEPMHGYQLMQEIAQRSDGVWKPSAGSVYPALAQLEDEGLVRQEDDGGRKVFTLTDAGRQYVEEHAGDLESPWDAVTGGVTDAMAESFELMREVGFAAMQVLRSGDPDKVERGKAILAETRRQLYLILAGETPES